MNPAIRYHAPRLALTLGLAAGASLIPAASTPGVEALSPAGAAAGAAGPDGIQLAQAATPSGEAAALAAMVAAADVAAGQTASFQCIGCHSLGEGEPARVGPNLYGLVGRPVASVEGFAYSGAMAAVGADGATWSIEFLNAFLTAPQTAIPGTSMGFGGIADEVTRVNLIAYLATLTSEPAAAEGAAAGVEAAAAPAQRLVSYSTEQADRGQSRYERDCLECHGADLTGGLIGGPPLSGLAFEQKYANGAPASVIFAFMSSAMPPERPGRFSPEVYADLMAYILSRNGFAAGAALPSDIAELSNLIMEK